ncbi:hypothetical protein B9479_002439 [Cryptococcus floricola]|uniref:Non-structural maintenance of chromosomes element 4 n=1 Tax=Cryptococcus floricola TaxID=2591691 RepID=A0A5D3B2P7_9TREE|nr:hypothetical protein B9479_002439 [Cryptococcus floricola]
MAPSRTQRSLSEEFAHSTQGQRRAKVTNAKDIFKQPDQEEQLRLGREYRSLQTAADEMKANLANATARDLAQALAKQSQLFTSVRDTGIGTLDANLIRTNAENAMGLAKRFKIDGVTFDIDEFLIKIKGQLGLDRAEMMDQDAEESDLEDDGPTQGQGRGRAQQARAGTLGDWEKLGWMAARYGRRMPGVEFMYGPLQVEYKPRNPNTQRQKQAMVEETQATVVEQNAEASKKTTDDFTNNIKTVYKILVNHAPDGESMNFFRLVVNPTSFGQTVENCFFLSFLIKDGKAGVYVEEDGEIRVAAGEPHNTADDGDVQSNQAVMEMDKETWELAIRTFGIKESAIPTRDYQQIKIQSDGWYS